MQIRVIRGAGDNPGEDINDPLLTTKAVGLERGMREINYETPKLQVNANCPLLSFTDTGTLAQVSEDKEVYRGKVTFFSLTIDIDPEGGNYYPSSSLRIERIGE